MIFWGILGAIQIIIGVISLLAYHKDFLQIVFGVFCIIAGLAYLYVVYLGATRVPNDQYEKDIGELKNKLKEADAKINILSKKANIEDLDEILNNERLVELSKVKINEMKTGFPVTLVVDKTVSGKTFSSGTSGVLYQRIQDDYTIKIISENKEFFVHCEMDEIENSYLHDLREAGKID